MEHYPLHVAYMVWASFGTKSSNSLEHVMISHQHSHKTPIPVSKFAYLFCINVYCCIIYYFESTMNKFKNKCYWSVLFIDMPSSTMKKDEAIFRNKHPFTTDKAQSI